MLSWFWYNWCLFDTLTASQKIRSIAIHVKSIIGDFIDRLDDLGL